MKAEKLAQLTDLLSVQEAVQSYQKSFDPEEDPENYWQLEKLLIKIDLDIKTTLAEMSK